MVLLIKSLVFSHLNYMPCVWGIASSQDLKQVDKLIRCAARLVLNKTRRDSITDIISNDLKWLGPKQLFYRALLITMFKIMKYDNSPELVKEMFAENCSIHSYSTRNKLKLHPLTAPTKEMGKKCFSYLGATAWNECVINKNTSLVTFKTNLTKFILNNVNRL
jgi:hypothetical protein